MLPRSGLALCREPGDVAALAWLCQEAHELDGEGWALPVEASNTALCRAADKGRGWCRSFLSRMEKAGVLTIARQGDAHTPREVLMAWPVPEPEKVIHNSDRYSDRYSEPSSGVVEQSDSLDDSQQERMYLETKSLREEIDERARDRAPQQRPKRRRKKHEPTDEEATALTTVWGVYRRYHPRADRAPTGESHARLLWALRERRKANVNGATDRCRLDPLGAAALQLELVIRWAHEAPGAYYLQGLEPDGSPSPRGAYLTIVSIFKQSSFDANLQRAREWASEGRPRNPHLPRDPALEAAP